MLIHMPEDYNRQYGAMYFPPTGLALLWHAVGTVKPNYIQVPNNYTDCKHTDHVGLLS